MTDHLETWQHIDDLRFENRQLRSENERLREACEAARPVLSILSGENVADATKALDEIDSALNAKGTGDAK